MISITFTIMVMVVCNASWIVYILREYMINGHCFVHVIGCLVHRGMVIVNVHLLFALYALLQGLLELLAYASRAYV